MRLTAGTRVGPYEVLALLGTGGMAEVYRARDTRLGRDVAIKVVSEALGADAALVERFEREAKLAGSLNHPNVVALYDVGFQDGKPYFVSELLQGESLRERLAKGPLPLATALEWAAQMAQGLSAAHARGIAHRDLKPENVFVTTDGHVKLIDFGIAKLFEAVREAAPHGLLDETVSPSGGSTGTGMVLGTPGYMSPEQVRGDPAVDARTDFFSLGAVLYEMLSGHRAFPSGSVVESGYAILHSEPEPLPPEVPAPVTQVVRRCLEKDAARRFQSARDLAFYLDLLRTPTAASWALPATPERRPLRRSGWPSALVGTVVALALVGLVSYLRGGAAVARPPSVQPLTFRAGTVWSGRFTAAGRVVYSAAWSSNPEELFAISPGSTEVQSLGIRAHLLSVSAQGELAVALHRVWFGVVGLGGTLAIVPSVGGAPRLVAEHVVYADWSSTGELAVVQTLSSQRRLEYPLGKLLLETADILAFPRVSPQGDTVAVVKTVGSSTRELLLVDRTGKSRPLARGEISGVAWAPSGDAVWFSDGAAIWASPLHGDPHLVYQGVVPMELQDISRDGRVLVNVEDERREVMVVPDGQPPRELSLLDRTTLVSLSKDGRQVLFTAYPGSAATVYMRGTDGSAPVKLGPGRALDFSPDDKWALVLTGESGVGTPEVTTEFSLVPLGVGATKTVSVRGLEPFRGRWLHDGKRIVVTAIGSGSDEFQLFVVPLNGGAPTRISERPVYPPVLEVSPDDRYAAAYTTDHLLTVFPVDGGPPLPLPELGKHVDPIGWTSDGQLWVTDSLTTLREGPTHLLRYDLKTRRVVEERVLSLTDLTGLAGLLYFCITPDSRTVGYEKVRMLGSLYLLDGLQLPRR